MFTTDLLPAQQKVFRAKAQLNLWVAKDLASSFGGKKTDYLKRLNRKLKKEILLTSLEQPIGHTSYTQKYW